MIELRNYLLKANNRNIKKSQENCQGLTIKTPELCHWHCYFVFIVHCELHSCALIVDSEQVFACWVLTIGVVSLWLKQTENLQFLMTKITAVERKWGMKSWHVNLLCRNMRKIRLGHEKLLLLPTASKNKFQSPRSTTLKNPPLNKMRLHAMEFTCF